MNIRKRKRCIIRNIASWNLNVKCVSVELGNLIGQDMWGVRSICSGAVVEKLMGMWGVGEDDEIIVKKMMRNNSFDETMDDKKNGDEE